MSSVSLPPGDPAARIWVGGLRHGISDDEVEREMSKYGSIRWVRMRTSPKDTYCFIQYENVGDALTAMRDWKRSRPIDQITPLGVIKVSMARPTGEKIRIDPRSRSRSRSKSRSRSRSPAGGVPETASYKLVPICRVEDLPEDFGEEELLLIGAEFGRVVRCKVWTYRGSKQGRLEYSQLESAARAWDALDERRVAGSQRRLRAYIPLYVR
eukprot:TRINITY_DN62123_c0_g1_i1.p1 TRINITY_DN62123_c0_g1~~TRINITY_DN62123_c0_g1_i1.p1  ORF type:complete len:232 (+),score=8.09 TRINITY_DN62123_c0_g1_i1:66-698(+)